MFKQEIKTKRLMTIVITTNTIIKIKGEALKPISQKDKHFANSTLPFDLLFKHFSLLHIGITLRT